MNRPQLPPQFPTAPAGWEIVRLGDVCKIEAGQSPPSATYRSEPEGLPFFQGKADFGATYPTPRVWCMAPVKTAKAGDILISVRAPVGPTNVANVDCCIGRGLAAIQAGPTVDPDFLFAALRLSERYLAGLGNGSTFTAISRRDLEELRIPLPSISKQRAIASKLQAQLLEVQRARAAAEARLEAARVLSEAEVRRVFEGDEAARWERASLSELLRDRGQYGLSVKTHSDPKGFPVLRMANLSPGEINWSNLKYVELSDSEASKYRLSDGDLLFNRTNSAELVGKTAVFRDGREALFASYLIRFRLKPEAADPDFVCAYVNSRGGRAYIREKMARAIGQVNISASQMVKMPVPVPALRRQNEIANNLKTWRLRSRELQDEIEVERARLAALRPALLRRAFSGEL